MTDAQFKEIKDLLLRIEENTKLAASKKDIDTLWTKFENYMIQKKNGF